MLWYSHGSESHVDANDVWDRLAKFAGFKVDDANINVPLPFVFVPKNIFEDKEYIGSVGACHEQKRTAADGGPLATYRHHVRLFYAFSFDRGGAFVVGDAHTDQCGGKTFQYDKAILCVSCHYALPSNIETRNIILHTWQQIKLPTSYHYLENTAYVYQSCGAPSKHRFYVHGDGYEISLQTVPKR